MANQYNAFKNIRTRMMRDPRFWKEGIREELLLISNHQDLTETDKEFIKFLASKPYHAIQWALTKPSLVSSHELAQKLYNLRIFIPQFYEFKVPYDILHTSREAHKEYIEARHHYQMTDPSRFILPREECVIMMEQAKAYIARENIDWSKKSNCLRLAECLCLLTGRRKSEILFSLKIRSSHISDYCAEISGLAKRFNVDEWFTIPLLAPIETIVRGISRARSCQTIKRGDYGGKQMWPGKTHTHFRNAFVDLAYEQKDINMFKPVACSVLSWKAAAICVDIGTLASHYQIMSAPCDQQENVESECIGSQHDKVASEDG